MNKKFNKREVKILKLMAAVVLLTVAVELYDGFMQKKQQLQFDIETEMSAQETFLEKLKTNPEVFQKKSNELAVIMAEAEERILKMDKESNAQFKFQEDITIVADKTGINLNSLNKRRSKELFKGSEMIQLKAYFGFNCPLVNLLEFLDQISHKDYFVAVDTLNVNVNTRRRRSSRRNQKEPEDKEITIRGSCVLATLYEKSQEDIDSPEPDTGVEDDEEDPVFEEPGEEAEEQVASTPSKSAGKSVPVEKKDAKNPPKDQPKLIGNRPPAKDGETKPKLVGPSRPLTHTKKNKARGF